MMGLLSKIQGRSKRSGTQADTSRELLEAKAEVARLKALPTSNWTPITVGNSSLILKNSVDRKAEAIAYAKGRSGTLTSIG